MPDVLQGDCLLYLLALDHLTQRHAVATLHLCIELLDSLCPGAVYDCTVGT